MMQALHHETTCRTKPVWLVLMIFLGVACATGQTARAGEPSAPSLDVVKARRTITDGGVDADFYYLDSTGRRKAVIILGGSEGGEALEQEHPAPAGALG